MNRAESIVCIISQNTGRSKELCDTLDDIGTHNYAVVDTASGFRNYQKDRTVSVALIDRALDGAQLESLAELRQPCPLVTFGVAESSSQPLQTIETAASYQLRHPAVGIDLERLFNHVAAQAKSTTAPPSNRSAHLYRGLVGESEAVVKLRKLIRKIAASKSTVLISGETGTGKEIVARNIHYYSTQSSGPFVPVNCSAIPPDLLESELFGHKKGAFTGATSDRVGRFALAAGGTLFLDEIGDMTPALQAKLLRVLEERIIQRVGCNKPIPMTARLVAATHRDLEQRILDGTFREDLFYRLNVVPIDVPSLRERKEDIPQLAEELSRRLNREQGISIEISPAALRRLRQHKWPGNVRELANLVERLAVICPSGFADLADLPKRYLKGAEVDAGVFDSKYDLLSDTLSPKHWPEDGVDLKSFLQSTEASLIQQALDHSGGTMAHAAQLLHVRRTTLIEKVKRLGLSESTAAMK